jgi:hypothetical protein
VGARGAVDGDEVGVSPEVVQEDRVRGHQWFERDDQSLIAQLPHSLRVLALVRSDVDETVNVLVGKKLRLDILEGCLKSNEIPTCLPNDLTDEELLGRHRDRNLGGRLTVTHRLAIDRPV